MHRSVWIFIIIFLVSLTSQLAFLKGGAFADSEVWADEAAYLQHGDPRAYDELRGYGHPGTTILSLTIAIHSLTGATYTGATAVSLGILIGLAIAGAGLLASALKPSSPWWIGVVLVLLLNRMYFVATPPSALIGPLTVLIFLTAWWLLQQPTRWRMILLGVLLGLATSTRFETGLLLTCVISLTVAWQVGARIIAPVVLAAASVFTLTNPFMWAAPIGHLRDLVYEVVLHHDQFSERSTLPMIDPFRFTPFAWIGLGWALSLAFRQRLHRHLPGPITLAMLVFSAAIIIAVISSDYKAIRYFFPITLILEALLPLFILGTKPPTRKRGWLFLSFCLLWSVWTVSSAFIFL